jgi:restriction system protein
MIAVPTFDKLMWPAVLALKSLGGSATNEELLAKLTELLKLPQEVQAVSHSDGRQTKVSYNLAWAKSYMKKAGLLDNSARGVWTLTPDGEACTETGIALVPARVRKMNTESRKSQKPDGPNGDIAAGPIEDEVSDIADLYWKDQLLNTLKTLSPHIFERLAQRLLREAGFIKVEVTGKSGDGGIDGIGVLRVNLLSFQVLFQCKRYQGSVGASAIRDFRGAMVGRSDKGLMITTGTFTPDAKREATRDGAPAIDLIDGDQLCDLLCQLKLGVRTELVEKMTVDTDWFGKL